MDGVTSLLEGARWGEWIARSSFRVSEHGCATLRFRQLVSHRAPAPDSTMMIETPSQNRYRHVEPLLALTIVSLKLRVLYANWGLAQGYDYRSWLEMFRAVDWFGRLPPPLVWGGSYHPPLSYLLARLVYAVYPHEVEASQVSSTLAIIFAFFAMREVMRRIGALYTVFGFWLLYGGFSIPLLIFLAVESTYDSWVLTWYLVVLLASVSMWWNPTPTQWWRRGRFLFGLLFCSVSLALGMFNKYSGLVAFFLPFFVILARRGVRSVFRECTAPILASVIAVAMFAPHYYERYYKSEGRWMPAAMDFQLVEQLKVVRAERDAAPGKFVLNVLRIPLEPRENDQLPVLDSFFDSTWLHTWTRDAWLGVQPPASLAVSKFYGRFFPFVFLAGTGYFFLRRRHLERNYRDLGLVLFLGGALYSACALYFAWKYPYWSWRIFKTKYMSGAVLFIAYVVGVALSDRRVRNSISWWRSPFESGAYYALIVFVLVNHLVPVY